MGKDREHNNTLRFFARLSLAFWLVFFLLDSLVSGGVSVFFNLNYLLALALALNIIDIFYSNQC
jgi:hypothetical protein